MEADPVATETIPETSAAERVVADVLAIGAPAAHAKRVRDSVPLWFHTLALVPGSPRRASPATTATVYR